VSGLLSATIKKQLLFDSSLPVPGGDGVADAVPSTAEQQIRPELR
jgi:hypothetical protein